MTIPWTEPITCPGCHEGHMIERNGKYGKFYGCSKFPICKCTLNEYQLNQLIDSDYSEPNLES